MVPSSRVTLLPLAALLFALLIASAQSACYDPTGLLRTDDGFAPCTNIPTICCAVNRNNSAGGLLKDGETKDECLPNGVCQNSFVDATGYTSTSYWRDFCTNQDWKSGECLNVCTQKDEVYKYGKFLLTPCDGTNSSSKWCCGDTHDCCGADATATAVTISPTFKVASPASSTTTISSSGVSSTQSSSTTTSTSAPASATTPAAGDNSGSASGLSTGAKAGIGIGAAAGGLIMLGLGFYIAKSLQWKRRADAAASESEHSAYMSSSAPIVELAQSPGLHEVYDGTMKHEMHAAVMQHELPENSIRRELP